jgi:hypothetical protein
MINILFIINIDYKYFFSSRKMIKSIFGTTMNMLESQ